MSMSNERSEDSGPGHLLAERRSIESPSVRRLAIGRLSDLVSRTFEGLHNALPSKPLFELSARHPWDATFGLIDAYHPGRWDATSNLVFMTPIHSTGPNPGEWDGTVIYGAVTLPNAANYIVVGNFSGYQTTMKLNGPWGTTTAYCAEVSDEAAVIANWSGSGSLWFTMSCTGLYLGYLESVQMFQLA